MLPRLVILLVLAALLGCAEGVKPKPLPSTLATKEKAPLPIKE